MNVEIEALDSRSLLWQVVSRQYLGDSQFHIGFWRVARSVLIFLGAPLAAAILTRLVGVST